MEIKRTMEIKTGRAWSISFVETDPANVYNALAHDLISKKLCGAAWITSIKRVQLYNGYINIHVSYNNGTRCTYTIKD